MKLLNSRQISTICLTLFIVAGSSVGNAWAGLTPSVPGTSSALAATSCPTPTSETVFTSCPLTGVTEINVRSAPFCASGGGTAAHDDTYAIQNALNAGLTCRIPVMLPAGYYYVSKSLYLNGHGSAAAWQTGAQLRGTGLYSQITGTLTEAYPVLDATGYNYGKIQDLTVLASGKATAGILLGVPGAAGTSGGTVTLERVSIGGGTIAAVVDLGSDLLKVIGSSFNGPTALVVSAANIVGIQSKFNSTLVADGPNAYGNGTLATISETNLLANSGAGIWVDGMDAVTVVSSYIHLGGTSTAAIQVSTQKNSSGQYIARGDSLNLYNLRCESSSTASQTYFLDLLTGSNSSNGTISGVACTNATGIHLPLGSQMLSYDINFGTSGHMPLIDGDITSSGTHEVGALLNSVINSAGSHGFLGTGSNGNTLLAFYIGTPGWVSPPGAFNSILSENMSAVGTPLQVTGEISPSVTDTYSLGDSAHLFTEVYAKGGVIQTSDARQKQNITNSDLGLEFIASLRPVSYRWKSGPDTDLHYGLIAQETEKAVKAAKTKSGRSPASDDQIIFAHDAKTDSYGIKYSELISPMIKSIQELKQENTALKSYICGKDPGASVCR